MQTVVYSSATPVQVLLTALRIVDGWMAAARAHTILTATRHGYGQVKPQSTNSSEYWGVGLESGSLVDNSKAYIGTYPYSVRCVLDLVLLFIKIKTQNKFRPEVFKRSSATMAQALLTALQRCDYLKWRLPGLIQWQLLSTNAIWGETPNGSERYIGILGNGTFYSRVPDESRNITIDHGVRCVLDLGLPPLIQNTDRFAAVRQQCEFFLRRCAVRLFEWRLSGLGQ